MPGGAGCACVGALRIAKPFNSACDQRVDADLEPRTD